MAIAPQTTPYDRYRIREGRTLLFVQGGSTNRSDFAFDQPVSHQCDHRKQSEKYRRRSSDCQVAPLSLRFYAQMRPSLWVPKMPSESFRPEFHQVDEFNFDSSFVDMDSSDSQSFGNAGYPSSKFGDRPEMGRTAYTEESTRPRQGGSFGWICCRFVIGASTISTVSSCPLIPMMKAADLRN